MMESRVVSSQPNHLSTGTNSAAEPSTASGDSDRQQAAAVGTGQDIIIFLCPTCDVKLNAPPKLAGRPGQCPHCQAKFYIPSLEELQAAQEQEEVVDDYDDVADETPVGALVDDEADEIEDFEEIGEFPDDDIGTIDHEVTAPIAGGSGHFRRPPLPAGAHAMAQTVSRLWEIKAEDSVVELYLEGGELLTPELFAVEISQREYGTFAVREEDGTFTLTVIPWSKIVRAVVKKVEQLPRGAFE